MLDIPHRTVSDELMMLRCEMYEPARVMFGSSRTILTTSGPRRWLESLTVDSANPDVNSDWKKPCRIVLS